MKFVSSEKKIYVIFLSIGKMYKDELVKEVQNRDIKELTIPKKCFAVQFFDVISAKFDLDGQIIETKSDRLNNSGSYYINAIEKSQEELIEELGLGSIHLDNLNNTGKRIIKCITGNYEPLNKGDSIITL